MRLLRLLVGTLFWGVHLHGGEGLAGASPDPRDVMARVIAANRHGLAPGIWNRLWRHFRAEP